MSMLIEEKDVTPVNLSVELERAVVSHNMDDSGDIYVSEFGIFPFWIKLRENSKFILLTTYTKFTRSSDRLSRLELCNKINLSNYVLTAFLSNDHLMIDHSLSFADGLLRENFIRTCRQYSSAISMSLQEHDPDHVVALRPGASEPEDTSRNESRQEGSE